MVSLLAVRFQFFLYLVANDLGALQNIGGEKWWKTKEDKLLCTRFFVISCFGCDDVNLLASFSELILNCNYDEQAFSACHGEMNQE